ncbi:uncharacterized protein PGTG_00933 [Puccinia graminis f. sp. tritici CRL 75-36-700-3]|uniref:Uncharacterized protein n=1 Tax=Puccinia graminis f. sp. tritici (strain CRL 75-36-700-3 / race SCCL) TaxID=418459 RepID=E3JU77_PUCGT|nr:uncharacterized protein PGTG_00933 [Puccinia graminis f. sp. tritici CRL 75-36-700-3]EFP75602.1 hypothetical protein PGTG_00933 [Puccinia graminis f. sp. tritici CRL 75-36-700-3]
MRLHSGIKWKTVVDALRDCPDPWDSRAALVSSPGVEDLGWASRNPQNPRGSLFTGIFPDFSLFCQMLDSFITPDSVQNLLSLSKPLLKPRDHRTPASPDQAYLCGM